MRDNIKNLRGNHAVDFFAWLIDVVDLETKLIQRIGDISNRRGQRRKITKP